MKQLSFVFLGFTMLASTFVQAQQDTTMLRFPEFMGYVKSFHPMARQATLDVSMAEANLLKSRGGFDPKLEFDMDTKQFKGSEYYDLLNATFKVPTWFGIELKAGFEQNDGEFLNPQLTVPEDGLYQAGISISVAQGLIMDARRATLRKAQWFLKQSKEEQELAINELLYNASVAYFDWVQAYEKYQLQSEFLAKAQERYVGVQASARVGDLAIIDTVEAYIPIQNRRLAIEQTRIDLVKKRLALSNFLWIQDNIPLELQEQVVPELDLAPILPETLVLNTAALDSITLDSHPKLMALEYKAEALEIDRKLKANMLLPTINLQYNALSVNPNEFSTFNSNDYKFGIQASFPLFLRKERGALKIAKYKLEDLDLTQKTSRLTIGNTVDAIQQEVASFSSQINLNENVVDSYRQMLAAEVKKFEFGESSIFLINSREIKLVEARDKQIQLKNKFYNTYAKLYKSLGRANLSL